MTEELGNYVSSFFIMNVPTEADIDIQNMSDADFAVFFHEYVHFLQDITSFYGYSGIYSHGEYLRRSINDIYKGPKQFSVPLQMEDKGDNVLLNKKVADLSLGDTCNYGMIILKDAYYEERKLTDTFKFPDFLVDVIADGCRETLSVGAFAIRENMAYLLEKRCTTKYKTSGEFPYQIVEIVAQKMCPGRLTDLEIIALCDIALQSSAPGYTLYMMLDAISKGTMSINKPEDIYDRFFLKKVSFLGQQMSAPQALRMAACFAIDHLLSYLKIETLSSEFQDWVKYTFSRGVEIRIQDPYFILNLAREKKNKDNAVLKHLARNLGSPQIINSKGNRFQLVTDRPICRFEYLEIVKEIESLFDKGLRNCSLKKWCKMSADGAPVDERCDSSPWKRCIDERLCPYGLLWKHWNLSGYDIIES